MKFWRIACPDYPGGDYDNMFVNGMVEHPTSIPGVRCEVCGTWSGSRVLPLRLPERLLRRRELNDAWPISAAEHRALCADVEAALATEGHRLTLRPGDQFQPAEVRLPTFPEVDFLWPGAGAIVSARVRDLLVSNDVRGVSFYEVTWRTVGHRRPILPAPVPLHGGPAALLEYLPGHTGDLAPPEYFEMVATAESTLPPGVIRRGACAECGREEIDTRQRMFDVRPKQWTGEDVFLLATTLYIIVTDGIKGMLERIGATNVDFVRLPISDV